MKHLKNFESYAPIDESILKDILNPIKKFFSMPIGYKWEKVKEILDDRVRYAREIENAKNRIERSKNPIFYKRVTVGSLRPDQKRKLQSKIDKFDKQYPNGFSLDLLKKEILEASEKNFREMEEDWKWFEEKVKSYVPTESQ